MELKNEVTPRKETSNVTLTEYQKRWLETINKNRLFSGFPDFLELLEKRKTKFNILIFMNMDTYYLYKLVKQQENSDQCKIMFGNCLEDSSADEFAGKNILLVDLSMTTGYKMFEKYCSVKKLGAEKVETYVYAKSIEFATFLLIKSKWYEIYFYSYYIYYYLYTCCIRQWY